MSQGSGEPGRGSLADPGRGAPGPQPAGRRRRHPARPARRPDRRERLGQELAGVRHALRRGPAAVHREPLELRPPVPRPARTARRRPDRGPAADRLDRPASRRRPTRGARSRTVTEIHDYLRLLYARTGIPHCPTCGQPIRRQTPEQMVASVLAMQRGTQGPGPRPAGPRPQGAARRGLPGDPPRRAAPGAGRRRRSSRSPDDPKLAKTKPHDIEAVVDRLVVREGIRPRLAESIDLALKLGEGIGPPLGPDRRRAGTTGSLSVNFACPTCGTGFEELEPRTFSFNSPYGACPTCDGLGIARRLRPRPRHPRSLAVAGAGGRRPLARPPTPSAGESARRPGARRVPEAASASSRHAPGLLARDGARAVPPAASRRGLRRASCPRSSARTPRRRPSASARRSTPSGSESPAPPAAAPGSGPRPGRSRSAAGRSTRSPALPIADARPVLRRRSSFAPPHDLVGPPLVREIVARLAFLDRVGLGYLTLDRGADTLSGGELQRVRLATQIGSGLVGVCYVLDEPTAGLHPRDTDRLLASLTDLRDQGNSVARRRARRGHDPRGRLADRPRPGRRARTAAASSPSGPPDALIESGDSLTARYLRRESPIAVARAAAGSRGARVGSRSVGASERNLKGDRRRDSRSGR